MNGWIKLHRKFLQWEWYDDINTKILFLHLLLLANHEDKKWHGITIKRGQILTGRKKLAKELGISEQSIRTALKHLKSTNEVTIKSTKLYSIITITNYDAYQETNQPTNQELTKHQPTSNQPLTTNKNEKNEKNNKNTIYVQKARMIVQKWNAFARKNNLPEVKKLSDARKRKLKVRLKEEDFCLDKILPEIEQSNFLLGFNKNGWTINFDWLIANDTNYVKVLEGRYRNKDTAGLTDEELEIERYNQQVIKNVKEQLRRFPDALSIEQPEF